MIQYKIVSRQTKDGSKTYYYPVITGIVPVRLSTVAEQIERQCTVSMPDIKAVLNALEYVVIASLRNGQSVRLGDLGSFRPTLSAKSVEVAKDCDGSLIQRARCRFTPSSLMNRSLAKDNISLKMVGEKSAAEDGGAGA